MSALAASAATTYADAIPRLPAGTLPEPLAALWRAQAEAGAPMRDTADVLGDTLRILVSLNADADVLAATLLDALVDVDQHASAAKIEIPERLQTLLEGQRAASRVWTLHRSHGGGRNPEGMRRLLLALVRDLRVVTIVLARQLSRMRAAWRLPADEQRALAQLTRDIHAPLANRLGIWQLKWELEDLAFRSLETETYLRIARLLDDNRSGRERWIEGAKAQLREALAAHGIEDADIAGRPKHIFSIWKKMRKKDAPIGELYDLRALRVLVDDVADCYAVLGLVHALWLPIPSEFDDYIARPKSNGYRSLHTAVVGPDGKTLEVQIRTREMHAQAELGVAAHWRYKEGGAAGGAAMDKRIAWMRKLLEQAAEAAKDGEASPLGAMEGELVEDRVYALWWTCSRARPCSTSPTRCTPWSGIAVAARRWTGASSSSTINCAAANGSKSSPARPPSRAATGCRRAAVFSPATARARKCAAGSTNSIAHATCRPGVNCWTRICAGWVCCMPTCCRYSASSTSTASMICWCWSHWATSARTRSGAPCSTSRNLRKNPRRHRKPRLPNRPHPQPARSPCRAWTTCWRRSRAAASRCRARPLSAT